MPDAIYTNRPAAEPAAARPAPLRSRRAPRAAYWIAAMVLGLAVLGAVAYGVVGTVRALDRPDHFARVAIPGQLLIQAAAGAQKTIYYEGATRPTPRALRLRVTGPTGQQVTINAYHGTVEYDIRGIVARAVASFNASTAGSYRVSALTAEPGAKLAVGANLGGQMKRVALYAGLILLAGLLAATALAGPTLRRRTR
jgi:hypothetical protein